MFAIAEIGSKQYTFVKGEILCIPRVPKKKEVSLTNLLLIADGKDVKIGTPHIKGAKAVCDVLGDAKGPKRVAFKFRKRKSSQKKIGHRELLSKVRVKEIVKG
ncbi:MAG: 50S ribosomal protein L21 [Candidatus Omnitrophota bacterium]|nr:MAG: 50S ribosomal protein L21 [Candidatus Omnitrophota bacterium]